MVSQRWIARVALIVALPVSLHADTLILRNGSRVQGELIAVRNGTIEFEERRTYGGFSLSEDAVVGNYEEVEVAVQRVHGLP